MNENTSIEASTSMARPQTSSSYSHTDTNQEDSHFVIAKCRRNNGVTENSAPEPQHESSEDSDTEEKVLAVVNRAGWLGAAYYTLQTGELFILEEIVDRPPEYHMFLNLFRQVEPVTLLLDGKTQGSFVQKVKHTVFSGVAESRCKLIFISAREYSFEACKRRVLTLSLPCEPAACSDEERAMFLRTVVDLTKVQTVHALGALLRYIDLNWSALSLNIHAKPQFLSLRTISLADIVTIDEDTYRGLQIFSTVAHPSGFKKGVHGSSREGLSLCQLFTKCSSKVGQSKMRVYLQHPTRDLTTLKRRQDVIAFFIRPQSDTILKNICSSLRFIRNVTGILAKIKALSAKAYQWKSLYNTIYNAILICEMCENARFESEFLEELASCDNHKLYEMALYMNRIIDFDLSKSEGKFTVKAGVDPDLDIKKQTMASLHTLMSETALVELSRLPEFIEECSMLYMPHLGYLLGVKAWRDDLTMEQKELPNMKFMFQNNDYIHYKSKGCEELDMMIGDTYPDIVAHETRIMMRLTAVIMENLHTLAPVIDKCAELDCLIAISKVCREYNYVRPILTEEKVISIKQGRHPLYIVTNDNFVPNDVESSKEACVKILTGPNSSGKSVYMKMIGLIVYLAHIGSFVPAESATVGVVTHVHSRMQAAECVATHMSAFLNDLAQMSVCVGESSPRSLVLVDEFGKGTARCDGLALLAACVHTLLLRGDHCPHTFVCTHYLRIHEFVLQSPIVQFMSFEHVMQGGSPVFLFRACAGAASSSLAHAVARSSGIESHVVRRAELLLDCYTNNSLPPPNQKILSKLKKLTEKTKNDLLTDI